MQFIFGIHFGRCIMSRKTEIKRNFILQQAKQLFIKKGFYKVTLKDIVEACGISRGGIYLYFDSVDEIFMEVIRQYHSENLNKTCIELSGSKEFVEILDEFWDEEKARILCIRNSLKLAMIEYFLSHKEDKDKTFFRNAMDGLKSGIQEILFYGVEKKYIHCPSIDIFADMIMLWIIGSEELFLSADVSEEFLDSQINLIKSLILSGWNGG